MSIGDDIKNVLEDVGVSVTIKGTTDSDGGYLDYDVSEEISGFNRPFVLNVTIPYDSTIQEGDVIEFSTGVRYMLVTDAKEVLQDEAILRTGVAYKCNVSGEVLRASGEVVNPATYQRETIWASVKEDCYALLTNKNIGTELVQGQPMGQLPTEAQVMFVPHSYGLRPLDRYSPQSGEYYKIETVMTRQFASVDVCTLTEDNR